MPLIPLESRVDPISLAICLRYYKSRGTLIRSKSELLRLIVDGMSSIIQSNFKEITPLNLPEALEALDRHGMFNLANSETAIVKELQRIDLMEGDEEEKSRRLSDELG